MRTPVFPRLRTSYRVTLTRKGQLTVPAAVWRHLGWQPGDRLQGELMGDGFAFRRSSLALSRPVRTRRRGGGGGPVTRRSRAASAHRHRFVLQGRTATARPDRAFVAYFVCPDCFAVKRRTYRILRTRLADETIVQQEPVIKTGPEEVVLP